MSFEDDLFNALMVNENVIDMMHNTIYAIL